MNNRIIKFCKDYLKENISKCSERQQLIFKRMYANKKLDLDIDLVIDKIPDDKLSWAMEQIDNTILKNSEDVFEQILISHRDELSNSRHARFMQQAIDESIRTLTEAIDQDIFYDFILNYNIMDDTFEQSYLEYKTQEL